MIHNSAPRRLSIVLILLCLSSVILFAAPEYVTVYAEKGAPDRYDFYADNSHFVPLYVTVDLPEVWGLEPETELPFHGMVAAESKHTLLFSLRQLPDQRKVGYRLAYSFAFGNPFTAAHDDSLLYLFPYEHATKRRVSQGPKGEFTHTGDNLYAIDFEMPVGTPVYAARAGLVVDVVEHYSAGGTSAQYGPRANRILIQHSDGSFGNYVHLKKDGSVVTPGDQVKAGELIGYSGNTGQSSGPHLHFDVRLPMRDGSMQSIPVKFRTAEGNAVSPEKNGVYYSYRPGGPPFEEHFGKDITDADYRDYARTVPQTNSLEFRTEQEDLTYVAFLANGYDRDVDVEISFSLSGLATSAHLPLKVTVPARTEIFVAVLHADPSRNSWQFQPRIRYWR